MFSRKRIRDKYVSWRKLFLQNWSLFKASRIGLVGLGIMIAFIIIAFLAPFMGLRDPLYWLAPPAGPNTGGGGGTREQVGSTWRRRTRFSPSTPATTASRSGDASHSRRTPGSPPTPSS